MQLTTFYQRVKDRYSPGTLRNKMSALNTIAKYIKGEPTTDSIQRFFDTLSQGDISPGTIRNYYHHLKTYCMVMGIPIDWDGVKMRMPTYPYPEVKVYSKEEVKAIIDNTRGVKGKLILYLTYAYARRIGEVVGIKYGDITGKYVRFPLLKKHKESYARFAMDDTARKLYSSYLTYRSRITKDRSPESPFFVSRFRGKVVATTTNSARNIMKRACALAGVPYYGCHALRHSRATHLLEAGYDMKSLQQGILHHEKLSTTIDIYWQMMEEVEEVPEVF